jgi:DNA adenine methylase
MMIGSHGLGESLHKTPFPWFGGKADAAPAVWEALGDVPHYVEPFAGSLAVLLRRPHKANRTYYSETVADTDSLLCNFWRSIQFRPQETAEAASWPVSELDKHARGCFLLKWRESEATAHLAGDPTWCDPLVAGWWAWVVCCSIGGWGLGGPWWPDADGRLRKRPRGRKDESEPGVRANLPHLSNDGTGVNRPQTREPGLTWDQCAAADYAETEGYHPRTMPELRRWFAFLSARLRHVRIINGDWTGAVNGSYKRVLTGGASLTLPVRQGKGPCGVFLDPPYGDVGRSDTLYAEESLTVAAEVRDWCLKHGDDKRYRIVYAGFDQEGADLVAAGWREVEWFRAGHLKGGMGNVAKSDEGDDEPKHQQHRERLWCSPHCLTAEPERELFR